VYFESGVSSVIQQIIDFKTACNCDIVITGGSEAWLHQTHGPNVKVVDMRATETLNGYLNTQNGSSGTNFPTGRWITVNGVGKFWAEPSHGSQNATEHHWHVIFN
jgi:predicted phosphoadenosine phosphosulfate sulfurtransferase